MFLTFREGSSLVGLVASFLNISLFLIANLLDVIHLMAVTAFEAAVVLFAFLCGSKYHRAGFDAIGGIAIPLLTLVSIKPWVIGFIAAKLGVLEFLPRELLVVNFDCPADIFNKVIRSFFFIEFRLYFFLKSVEEKGYQGFLIPVKLQSQLEILYSIFRGRSSLSECLNFPFGLCFFIDSSKGLSECYLEGFIVRVEVAGARQILAG